MATTSNLKVAAESALSQDPRKPKNFLVLWHLLSLDAPTVAVVWTWFIAEVNQTHLRHSAVAAMGIAVWMLYASDRLLDTRPIVLRDPKLACEWEERHLFHRSNYRAISIAIAFAAIALSMLLPLLPRASMGLYLILGGLLAAYFIVIHLVSGRSQTKRRLPKELAVGLFFSAGVFISTVARRPELRSALLPGAVLFAVLCSLNCLFIYSWEHSPVESAAHPATLFALRFLHPAAAVTIVGGIVLALGSFALPWRIPVACAASAALLLLLDRNRTRLASSTLRAAADLCLLTPLCLVPFLPR